MEAELLEVCPVKNTIREQFSGAQRRVMALKSQLKEAQLALETRVGESTWTEADLKAQVLAVEEALTMETSRVERLERGAAAVAKKGQQLLAERREMSETASRQLAESGESLQVLQFKVAIVTAELREWRELATEITEKLKVANADVVWQSRLW